MFSYQESRFGYWQFINNYGKLLIINSESIAAFEIKENSEGIEYVAILLNGNIKYHIGNRDLADDLRNVYIPICKDSIEWFKKVFWIQQDIKEQLKQLKPKDENQ